MRQAAQATLILPVCPLVLTEIPLTALLKKLADAVL